MFNFEFIILFFYDLCVNICLLINTKLIASPSLNPKKEEKRIEFHIRFV